MRGAGQPAIIRELIGAREREAGAGQERREPARVNAIATCIRRLRDAVAHDRSHRRVAHVDPTLVRIAGQRIAEGGGREARRVVAERLHRAGAEVADREPSGGVQPVNHRGRRLEVEGVDAHVERRVERSRELDLPARERLGRPNRRRVASRRRIGPRPKDVPLGRVTRGDRHRADERRESGHRNSPRFPGEPSQHNSRRPAYVDGNPRVDGRCVV